MKKFLFSILFLFSSFFVFGFDESSISHYTFQNGLSLYFLEDTTSATVRMELNINSGISDSTKENSGFFQLYSKILNLSLTNNVVKKEVVISPLQTQNALNELFSVFEFRNFSDSYLSQNLNEFKRQTKEFSSSLAGFINSAIDSRVLNEPWKSESSVNIKNFDNLNIQKLRTYLKNFHEKYFVPENANLYVSGNISEKSILSLIENYFSDEKKNLPKNESLTSIKTKTDETENKVSQNKKNELNQKMQKFVLVDDEISDDITQIVLQYKDFSQNEADFLASVFENSSSNFKKLLLKQRNLSILGSEYINVASSQDKYSSRLIIQAICQKTKVSPLVQSELFLQMAQENNRILQNEAENAIKSFESNFNFVTDNSTLLMKNLAVFNQTNKDSTETLFNKNERLKNTNIEELNKKFSSAKPYVFVLCNKKVYLKNQNQFKKANYIPVTKQNDAWFKQKKFQSQKVSLNLENAELFPFSKIEESGNRFVKENKASFSKFSLQNKIPVTVKNVPSSKTSVISLLIDGGDLLFTETPGLSQILTNSLASLIQRSLDFAFEKGILNSFATIRTKNQTSYSILQLECQKVDFYECLKIFSETLIFADIYPSLADAVSFDLRSQWKIKCGQSDFQLLCEGIRTIYGKSLGFLYDDKNDKPPFIDFTLIQSSYPVLLDSTRHKIVIAGDFPDSGELKNSLNETFGILSSNNQTKNIDKKVEKLALPKDEIKLQLRHQFFTDISKENAPSRPAILIPTTDFSDPLVYFLDCPLNMSKDNAVFTGLLYELEKLLNEKLLSEQEAIIFPSDSDIPYARIVITKVKSISKTNRIFSETVNELLKLLENEINSKMEGVKDLQKSELLTEIENLYVLNELGETQNLNETVFLIQEGNAFSKPESYLENYETILNATEEDYFLVAKAYLQENPPLKIYSADSKR